MTRKVARHFSLARPRSLFLLLLLAIRFAAVAGAEIRGIVNVETIGLFGQRPAAVEAGPLSVAIFPLDGSLPVRDRSTTHGMEIRDSQMQPPYIAIARGDRVRFENQDGLYHELFSISAEQPFVLRLGERRHNAASGGQIQFDRVGTWHVFCRVHGKTYGRIDVLDTPFIKMVPPGEPFSFHRLSPGRWRMRIATPGAQTRTLETLARSAATPLHETLTVRRGALGRGDPSARPIDIVDLFPPEPGP